MTYPLTIEGTAMPTKARSEMTLRERLEDDERLYEIDLTTAAEWAVERFEKRERQARSNVTRTANEVAKLRRTQAARVERAVTARDEGTEIGRTEARVARLASRVDALAWAAHDLNEARDLLASLKAAV